MTLRNPELEVAILMRPDDLDAHLVYGDWLAERGDPQGELVAVHARIQGAGEDPSLEQRLWDLMSEVSRSWPEPLQRGYDRGGFSPGFELGFVRRVTLSEEGLVDRYRALFEMPRIELVGTLRIEPSSESQGPSTYYDGRSSTDPSWSQIAAVVRELGLPPGVTSLELTEDRDYAYWDNAEVDLGDLAAFDPFLGSLESLHVDAGRMESTATFDMPRLRSLRLDVEVASASNVAAIANAAWPALESLAFGATGATPASLAKILDGASLPVLSHLAIGRMHGFDDLVVALAGSKLLPRLRSLSLLGSDWGFPSPSLSDAGTRALVAHTSDYDHLERLDLCGHRFTPEARVELAKLCPDVRFGPGEL